MTVRSATPLPVGRKPRRDDVFECTIEALGPRGARVSRWADFSVRLRDGVPGEVVRAQVTKRRGNRLDARVLAQLEPSPRAVAPRCAHFASCGGCSFQDVAYAEQLEQLVRLAEAELQPLSRPGAPVCVEAAVPCDPPWAYRNKMDFTFSARRWIEPDEVGEVDKGFALGLHAPGRYDKVLDVRRCELQFEAGNAILATARRLARELGLTPWDTATRSGLLRHLVLRHGVRTGQTLVYLIVSRDGDDVDAYARAILAEHDEITTFVVGVNTRPAAVAVGETERIVSGPGFIRERICGIELAVSPSSFFQTNTAQAEKLVELVRREAAVEADDVVLDLYCGAGTFGLALASDAREVIGFEKVPAAVVDARANAQAAGLRNLRFVAGDVADTFLSGDSDLPRPDVVVVDPPRAGLHPRVVTALAELASPRVVYVSCNPRSAAVDVAPLLDSGYVLVRTSAIDLFPHTPHVELVLTLVRGEHGP